MGSTEKADYSCSTLLFYVILSNLLCIQEDRFISLGVNKSKYKHLRV